MILQDIRSILHNDTCSPYENEAYQMPTKVKRIKECREVKVEKNTVFRIPVSRIVYVISHSNRQKPDVRLQNDSDSVIVYRLALDENGNFLSCY